MLINQTPSPHGKAHRAYQRLPGWKLRWMLFMRETLPKWLDWRVLRLRRHPRPGGAKSGREMSPLSLAVAVLALYAVWSAFELTSGAIH